jgi:hypothetical protein
MHVSHVQITRFAHLADVGIALNPMMTVLAGPPSCGLTTMLRAIAIACDDHGLAQCYRDPLEVRSTFGDVRRTCTERSADPKWLPLRCVSYGARRPVTGAIMEHGNHVTMFPFMTNDRDIANVELLLRRRPDKGSTLERALGWSPGTIAIERLLTVRTQHGVQSFSALGDSDRGLLTRVADIVQWQVQELDDRGLLVLIDEVELRLHHDQQWGLLSRLLDVFPGVQFVVTTKSTTVRAEAHRHGWLRDFHGMPLLCSEPSTTGEDLQP